MTEERYKSFSEFWPFYVAEHSRPGTRVLHFIGTTIGVTLVIYFIATGRWWLFLLGFIPGYGFAWLAHFLVEKNRPATFKYPLWSLMGDYKMIAHMLTGKMGWFEIVRGNIPISEIPLGEDVWLVVLVTSVRERRTQQGRLFCDVSARNASGSLALKIWGEVLETQKAIKPGLWGVTGKLELYQDKPQFVVAEYRPITIEQYREHQNADPHVPRAYTLDIETLTLPDFRERVGPQLERQMRLGNMRAEQQQRYLEDIAAEEERCYALGSLSATSGRILSIAVHVDSIPGLEFPGLETTASEHVFGIDRDGFEQPEKRALLDFLALLKDFDGDCDELVGHNIVGFDLPFIFQRCLVQGLPARPFVNLGDYNVRGVFDTMHRWWLGSKRHVSLDDIAWVLGIESSKTAEVEGSKVFDLYQAGRLELIRDYNLNDVRVTRKIYERMVASFGR